MLEASSCFAEHGKYNPLVAGAPGELQLAFQMQQQAL